MVITVFNSFTNFVVQFRHNENSHDDITKEERWKIIFIHLLYFMMYEETARFNTAMKGNSSVMVLPTAQENGRYFRGEPQQNDGYGKTANRSKQVQFSTNNSTQNSDGSCLPMDATFRDDKDTEKVIYHGILVVGFLFAVSALCGNVYLFINQRQIQSDIVQLRQDIIDSRGSLPQQTVRTDSNLINLLYNQTQNLISKIDQLQLWANKSACLKGSGFISG